MSRKRIHHVLFIQSTVFYMFALSGMAFSFQFFYEGQMFDSHLSSAYLQPLQSHHGPLGCFSEYCCPPPACLGSAPCLRRSAVYPPSMFRLRIKLNLQVKSFKVNYNVINNVLLCTGVSLMRQIEACFCKHAECEDIQWLGNFTHWLKMQHLKNANLKHLFLQQFGSL